VRVGWSSVRAAGLSLQPGHYYRSLLRGSRIENKNSRPLDCAPLGSYAASSGNSLPTLRDNLSITSPKVKNFYS